MAWIGGAHGSLSSAFERFESVASRATAGQSSRGDASIGEAAPPKVHATFREALEAAQYAGFELSSEADSALKTLSDADAAELLSIAIGKLGFLRDPSNYIVSTIVRGYQSRKSKGTPKGSWAGSGVGKSGQQAVQGALFKAEDMGLELNAEAKDYLTTLAPNDAMDLVEATVAKAHTLRDPSNYIIVTISKGYVSRTALPSAPPPAAHGLRSPNQALIPHDVSALELRVLEMNAQGFWNEAIDVVTLLALRCIPPDQAMDVLEGMQAKSAKGSGISSPNNYVQAAITKIRRGEGRFGIPAGKGDGKKGRGEFNLTGNLSTQKAIELGLDLMPEALQSIAAVPMREANHILETAATQASQGVNPSEYVLQAVDDIRARGEPVKRPRSL